MKTVEIEVVDIRKITGEGNLKAFADVKIAETLVVKGVKLMNGKNGVFVSMPAKAGKDGRWFDIVMPVSEEVKREFEDKILEAYDRETDGVRN